MNGVCSQSVARLGRKWFEPPGDLPMMELVNMLKLGNSSIKRL